MDKPAEGTRQFMKYIFLFLKFIFNITHQNNNKILI